MNGHRIKTVLLLFTAVVIMLCLTGCQGGVSAFGGLLSYISYEHSENYLMGAAELSDAVTSIEISWAAGTVTVMTHPASTVSFSETCAQELTDDMRLRYWLDGTTLRIVVCRTGQWQLDHLKKDLTVMVPDHVKLESLSISSVSAAISLAEIDTCTADIDTASGSVRLTDCAVTERLGLSTVSGRLDARLTQPLRSFQSHTTSGACDLRVSSVTSCQADSVSGTVDVSVESTPEDLNIRTVSGNVSLSLPQNASFTLAYRTTSGALSSALPYLVEHGQYRFGDGEGAFGIVTVSGNARISVSP